VFRGVVEATLGSNEVSLIEIAFSKLAIRDSESFFVAHRPVMVEGLFKRRHGLVPLAVSGLLECEVIVKNPESSVVLKLAQKIHGFKIVGTCFLRMIRCNMKIAEVD